MNRNIDRYKRQPKNVFWWITAQCTKDGAIMNKTFIKKEKRKLEGLFTCPICKNSIRIYIQNGANL